MLFICHVEYFCETHRQLHNEAYYILHHTICFTVGFFCTFYTCTEVNTFKEQQFINKINAQSNPEYTVKNISFVII